MAKRLIPVVDRTLCISCRACVAACPYEVLEMDEENIAAVVNPWACEVLRACEEACPTVAITIEEVEVPDHPPEGFKGGHP